MVLAILWNNIFFFYYKNLLYTLHLFLDLYGFSLMQGSIPKTADYIVGKFDVLR